MKAFIGLFWVLERAMSPTTAQFTETRLLEPKNTAVFCIFARARSFLETSSPGVAACISIALESMSEYQHFWAQKKPKQRHVVIKCSCLGPVGLKA